MQYKKILLFITAVVTLMWLVGAALIYRDAQSAQKILATMTGNMAAAATSSSLSDERLTPVMAQTQERMVDEGVPATETTRTVHTEAASPAVAREMIPVTLQIDGKNFSHTVPSGASVEALLVTAQESGELNYVGKNYSGLGTLITAINGKQNNAEKNNLYWIFSVNGTKAHVGVSQYILHANDVVTWTYEANTY